MQSYFAWLLRNRKKVLAVNIAVVVVTGFAAGSNGR